MSELYIELFSIQGVEESKGQTEEKEGEKFLLIRFIDPLTLRPFGLKSLVCPIYIVVARGKLC